MKFTNIIADTTKQVRQSWSNKDKLAFHYFNPNGLYARKEEINKQIDALVDCGKAKTGAIIAYGSLSMFSTDKLRELYMKDRVSAIDYIVWHKMMTEEIQKAEQFILESN